MKIAILCLVIYAFVVYANEEDETEPETKHASYDTHQSLNLVPYNQRQVYWPVGQPQPRPQPLRAPRRRYSPSEIVILYLLLRSLNPATTTTSTTEATTTATTTASTTADPLADWTEFEENGCYYIFPETPATWENARGQCEGLISGGRLIVTGFQMDSGRRTALMDAVGASGNTYWMGANGVVGASDVDSPSFIAPSEGVSTSAIFTSNLFDNSLTPGDEVCARVDGSNPATLQFEQCDSSEHRYLCEFCET